MFDKYSNKLCYVAPTIQIEGVSGVDMSMLFMVFVYVRVISYEYDLSLTQIVHNYQIFVAVYKPRLMYPML
jgi:hypothetical protein